MAKESNLGYQLPLLLEEKNIVKGIDIEETLIQLLKQDLTFRGEKTNYATHNLHAFAAKFPPQLPRAVMKNLTAPGEVVLDPMVGSGTTLVEALLLGRHGIGVDLDPLSSLISRVKTLSIDPIDALKAGNEVLCKAWNTNILDKDKVLKMAYLPKSVEFFEYWFYAPIIEELFALLNAIYEVKDEAIKDFLKVVFSSIIITKSGGVTRALDLAHSRPHRVLDKEIKQGALEAFKVRLEKAVDSIASITHASGRVTILQEDVRGLSIADSSVDLIVTSPPYAANAIDYMRANKFSLIWFGYDPAYLSKLRRNYIGSEIKADNKEFESETANKVLHSLRKIDEKRASIITHYYQDMQKAIQEMYRVLKDGRACVLVVGSSVIKGIDIKAPTVIAELATSVGFDLVGFARREIERNSRLMPTSHKSDRAGIEARMHEEGIIGLIKPQGRKSRGETR